MDKFIKKITSRKFLVAVVGIVSGLATAFSNSHNTKIAITGYCLAGISGVVYMLIEGKIDANSISNIITSTAEKIETSKDENAEG